MIEIAAAGFLESILGIDKIANDMNLLVMAFKIVVLLFVIQFIRNRFGGGTILNLMMIALGYLMFFSPWSSMFQFTMLIYLFIAFGFVSILFDLSIAKPWASKAPPGETSYHESHERNDHIRGPYS